MLLKCVCSAVGVFSQSCTSCSRWWTKCPVGLSLCWRTWRIISWTQVWQIWWLQRRPLPQWVKTFLYLTVASWILYMSPVVVSAITEWSRKIIFDIPCECVWYFYAYALGMCKTSRLNETAAASWHWKYYFFPFFFFPSKHVKAVGAIPWHGLTC